MEFDIAVKAQELAVEDDGKIVHIHDANGEPAYYGGTDEPQEDGTTKNVGGKPVTWRICGVNSKQWQQAEAWQKKAVRKYRGRDLTVAENAAIEAEFVARCSKGNEGFTLNGQPLPFTTENATKVLVALPYIKRQLYGEMGDHEGFTKPASSN